MSHTEPTTSDGPALVPVRPARVKRQAQWKPRSLLVWRRTRGINQRTAAEALGMTQAMYSRLERGTTIPKPKLAQRLSVLTGIKLEALLGLAS